VSYIHANANGSPILQYLVDQFINPETGFICTTPYGRQFAIEDDQQEIWLNRPDPYAIQPPLPINTLLGSNDYNIYQYIESIVGDFHIALQNFCWRFWFCRINFTDLSFFPLGSVVYCNPSNGISQIGYFGEVSFRLENE
jgi:hypothetical protein